jgi:hypothetical protein
VAVEAQVRLRRSDATDYLADVDERFLTRDYTAIDMKTFSLVAGTKTLLDTNLSTVELLYIRRTGDSTDIKIYRGSSPEYWTFNDMFMAFVMSETQELYVTATVATTILVYMAGS